MEYLDNEHKMMRFLTKPKKLGKIFLAHLDYLKPVGNDYKKLCDIRDAGGAKNGVSEIIDLTDAEFDMEKVKEKWAIKGKMTKPEFDATKTSLEKVNFIKKDKFEAETIAIQAVDDVQKTAVFEDAKPIIKTEPITKTIRK